MRVHQPRAEPFERLDRSLEVAGEVERLRVREPHPRGGVDVQRRHVHLREDVRGGPRLAHAGQPARLDERGLGGAVVGRLLAVEQVGHRDAEHLGHPGERVLAQSAAVVLDVRDVGGVHPGLPRELALAQPGLLAGVAHTSAQRVHVLTIGIAAGHR